MAERHSFEPYLVTPLDHIYIPNYVHFFATFRVSDTDKGLAEIRRGIAQLATLFPFMTGHLVESDSIYHGKNGATLALPSTDENPGKSFLQVKYIYDTLLPKTGDVGNLDESYAPLGYLVLPPHQKPTLRFQANVLADGIILCLCANHRVFDASGCGTVFELLAQCMQHPEDKSLVLATTAAREAETRKAIFAAANIAVAGGYDDPSKLPTLLPAPSLEGVDKVALVQAFKQAEIALKSTEFTFSAKKITTIRERCNALLQNQSEKDSAKDGFSLTDNDIITSLLWLCITRAHHACPKTGEVSQHDQMFPFVTDMILLAVNLRRRMDPPLPDSYTGNAVVNLQIQGSSTEWASKTASSPSKVDTAVGISESYIQAIMHLASQTRTRLRSFDSASVNTVLSSVMKAKDWLTIMFNPLGMVMTTWRHLDVYKQVFGVLGKMENFGTLPAKIGGRCVVLPARDVKGKAEWEVSVTLKDEEMEVLEGDELFRWVRE